MQRRPGVHVAELAKVLAGLPGVDVHVRGNQITLQGERPAVEQAATLVLDVSASAAAGWYRPQWWSQELHGGAWYGILGPWLLAARGT